MKKTLPFLAAALLLGGSLNAAAADLTTPAVAVLPTSQPAPIPR